MMRRGPGEEPFGTRWRRRGHWAWLALAAVAGTTFGTVIARRRRRSGPADASIRLNARLLGSPATRSSPDGEDPCQPSNPS